MSFCGKLKYSKQHLNLSFSMIFFLVPGKTHLNNFAYLFTTHDYSVKNVPNLLRSEKEKPPGNIISCLFSNTCSISLDLVISGRENDFHGRE